MYIFSSHPNYAAADVERGHTQSNTLFAKQLQHKSTHEKRDRFMNKLQANIRLIRLIRLQISVIGYVPFNKGKNIKQLNKKV